MALLAVLVLAILWVALFMPAVRRSRLDSSPVATVGMFRQGMRVLGGKSVPAHGRWVLMPKTPDEIVGPRLSMIVLRRRIFTTLVAVALGTLLLGLIPGLRDFLKIHLSIDLMLVGFVMYLLGEKYRKTLTEPRHAIGLAPALEEPEYLKAGHF